MILRKTSITKLIAFLAGLGSLLFIPTPFGRVAIFDLICYFVFFILIAKWASLSKMQRRIVYLSLLWVVSAVISNFTNNEPSDISLKNFLIVFDVTCMLVCSFLLLNNLREAFVWFIIGNGLSGILSFYVFPNGALLYFAEASGYNTGNMANFLIAKQVYPAYADAIIKAVLYPLAMNSILPMLLVNLLLMAIGIFLLTIESRSTFGIFAASSLMGLAYLVKRNLIEKILKRFVLTIIIMILGGYILFQSYAYLAKSGKLGESGKRKFEKQIIDSELGFFGVRDDFLYFVPFLAKSPLLGVGAQSIDRFGIAIDVRERYGITDEISSHYDYLPGHSILFGAWIQNGIGGGIFWIYIIVIVVQFLRKIPIYYPLQFPFYFYFYLSFLYAILFSPFGLTRGLFCFLIAFASINLEEFKIQSTVD